jgi:histidine triad (HIT) family protein
MDCVFCKIVKGDIPSHKVYEDKDFLAFLDINPLNPGHTLIIPKKHYRWIWDIENLGEFFEFTRKVAKALQKAMNTEWVVCDVVGILVLHAHAHLVPRFKHDGHKEFLDPKAVKDISKEEMENIARKIRESF